MSATIFFNGTDASRLQQLWVSDGTGANTKPLDIPGLTTGLDPSSLTPYQGEIYFAGVDGLYKSNGTVAGTMLVDAGIAPEYMAVSGSDLYVLGPLGQLSVSVAGAPLALVPTERSAYDYFLTPYDGGVVFYTEDSIWFAKGNTAYSLLTSSPELPYFLDSAVYGPPLPPVAFGNNELLFTGFDSSFNQQYYITDGTEAGTRQIYVPGVAQGFGTGGPQPYIAFAWGNRVVFNAKMAAGSDDFFVSDGTTGGTHDLSTALASLVATIETGIVFDGDLLLAGRDAAGHAELLLTDGTAAGTAILAIGGTDDDFYLSYGFNSAGRVATVEGTQDPQAVVVGDVVYFAGTHDGTTGLWRSDGTVSGTYELQVAGAAPFNPIYFPTFNGLQPTAFASLNPAYTFYGDLNGRSTIQGTGEDDTIITYGGSNVVYGNGGSDTILLGSGGYSRVIQGHPTDQAVGSTTIALAGPGNVVTGGDEDFAVTGGTGNTSVMLGNGNDSITLGGSYDSVTLDGGTNTVSLAGGNGSVTLIAHDAPNLPDDTISLSGQHNTVELSVSAGHSYSPGIAAISGGEGYGVFDLFDVATTLTTGGLYNRITTGNPDARIVAGSGYDTVTLSAIFNYRGAPPTSVTLAGTHNLVQGFAPYLTVTGGAGSNTYLLNDIADPAANATVAITAGGLYNKIVLSETNGNTVVAGSGADSVTIAAPASAQDVFGMTYPVVPVASSVTFAGVNNSLTVTDAATTVSGGDGSATYTLGNGDDSVVTGGALNFITLGGGTDAVDPGSDHDTVVLNGSNAAVTLHGDADKVTLNAGASGSIGGDAAPDLRVYVSPGIGAEIINGILNDPRAIIDLRGGAGGYATAQQAYAALTPDGSGGSRLAIGSGAIDFAGAPKASLSSHMFTIG